MQIALCLDLALLITGIEGQAFEIKSFRRGDKAEQVEAPLMYLGANPRFHNRLLAARNDDIC